MRPGLGAKVSAGAEGGKSSVTTRGSRWLLGYAGALGFCALGWFVGHEGLLPLLPPTSLAEKIPHAGWLPRLWLGLLLTGPVHLVGMWVWPVLAAIWLQLWQQPVSGAARPLAYGARFLKLCGLALLVQLAVVPLALCLACFGLLPGMWLYARAWRWLSRRVKGSAGADRLAPEQSIRKAVLGELGLALWGGWALGLPWAVWMLLCWRAAGGDPSLIMAKVSVLSERQRLLELFLLLFAVPIQAWMHSRLLPSHGLSTKTLSDEF